MSSLRASIIAGLALTLTSVANGYDIKGFVVDDDNQPVAGATVSLEGTTHATTTDSLGAYLLKSVDSGVYNLSVRRECLVTGFVPDVRIPRPIQVPLPVVAHRITCTETIDPRVLSPEDLAVLTGLAFEGFVEEAKLGLAGAFLRDGAVALVAANGELDEAVMEDGTRVPVQRVEGSASEPVAIDAPLVVQVCFRSLDDDTALVLMLRATPPVPEELNLFVAERTLQTYERIPDGAGWRPVHQTFCLSEPADGDESITVTRDE